MSAHVPCTCNRNREDKNRWRVKYRNVKFYPFGVSEEHANYSKYSTIVCLDCSMSIRSKCKYVDDLLDLDSEELLRQRFSEYELKKWKEKAHAAFDIIWKLGYMKRSEAYSWLSKKLKIEKEKTHMVLFDVKMCKIVARISKEKMISFEALIK